MKPLSPREDHVLRLTVTGQQTYVIAQTLRISEGAVRSAQRRAYRKIGAIDRDHATQIVNQPTAKQYPTGGR